MRPDSVVQGVRRWISSQPSSHSKKLPGKSVPRSEVRKQVALPELDRHSTEAMARQLLEPYVSDTEEAEYQG